MSMDYWGIVGYGICLDDIYNDLNSEKINSLVREMNPQIKYEEDDDVLEDETFSGEPYLNIADFLCHLDEDDIFSWDDDGQGAAYFLYTPPYPWKITDKEPKNLDDLAERMINILTKVYDTPINDLKKILNYISTVGCC